MSANSKIEWTKETWNPVTGCDKISPGCKNCYAEKMANRLKNNPKTTKYRNGFNVTCHPESLNEPFKYKKPTWIFVCSMGDICHESIPYEFVQQIFDTIRNTPQHVYILLTKRPERFNKILPPDWGGDGWPNVMLMVTAENQPMADERLPILMDTPARWRGVSIEPMLGETYIRQYLHPYKKNALDWVICGCESGPHRRTTEIEWARILRQQCRANGVPFFLKQMVIDGKLVKEPFLDGKQWTQRPVINP